MISDEEQRVLKRWFSVGDLLTVLAMIVALAVSHGRLSTQVESLTRAVVELESRDITSGARSGLAEITARNDAKNAAQDQQITQLWQEVREQRREIADSLVRLETRLADHDEK